MKPERVGEADHASFSCQSKPPALSRWSIHFDQNVTPPNMPLNPIIERIPHCVEGEELSKFFNDMAAALPLSIFDQVQCINRVFDAVIPVTNNITVNVLLYFLLKNGDYLVNLLREFPQHVILLDHNPEIVRCLWRKHIFLEEYHQKDTSIFLALLRYNLIPQEEISEVNVRAIAGWNGDIPSQVDKILLDQYDFFRELFKGGWLNDFEWGNRNAKLVCWQLDSYPIQVEAVRSICFIFTKRHFPWDVRDELKKLFKENLTKRHEFEKIAQQEQLTLPKAIFGE